MLTMQSSGDTLKQERKRVKEMKKTLLIMWNEWGLSEVGPVTAQLILSGVDSKMFLKNVTLAGLSFSVREEY